MWASACVLSHSHALQGREGAEYSPSASCRHAVTLTHTCPRPLPHPGRQGPPLSTNLFLCLLSGTPAFHPPHFAPYLRGQVDVCPPIKQQLHHIEMATGDGQVQAALATRLNGEGQGRMHGVQLENGPCASWPVDLPMLQPCPSRQKYVLLTHTHLHRTVCICSAVQQQLRDLDMTLAACLVQGRLS